MNPEVPFIILGSLGMAVIAGWLLRPLVVGWGRRLEGGSVAELAERVEAMRREHQQELDAVQQRLADVEERLEFSERVLSREREQVRIAGPNP